MSFRKRTAHAQANISFGRCICLCPEYLWFSYHIFYLQVRIFKFKPEPYAENSFMSFQGMTKPMMLCFDFIFLDKWILWLIVVVL
jgi:hypothetical protein